MKTINICLLSLGILAAFILSGCHEPIQTYPGPKLPNSKVALLQVPFFTWDEINYLIIDENVIIDGSDLKKISTGKARIDGNTIIDGNDLRKIWTGTASMLPGKHEIKWSIKEPRGNFSYLGHGILNARAGENYQIFTSYETYPVPIEPDLRSSYDPIYARVKSVRTWIGCHHKEDWEEFAIKETMIINKEILDHH